MISKDFFESLKDLESEKKINQDVFISALETALTAAYKKNAGEAKNASVKLNPEKCTIKIYSYKTVVENVEDEDKEISLEDARQIKKSYAVGDIVEKEEFPKDFGRIAAQTAKQVILQKLREAEREITLGEIAEKQDTLVTTVIKRIDGENVFVELGNAEAIMPKLDQLPGEKYQIGQRIKVYVKKIKDGLKGPMLQVSRANAGFVKKLFELEVPEIENGDVEIVSIARDAGNRTKIAIKANNANIDAVGACVGNKGMRINSIVNEINGEKIDIIEYSDNVEEYVSRALSPATTVKVEMIDEFSARAIVPDDKLSLAIGKGGLNVKLAARLTHIKIDVKSASSMEGLVVSKKPVAVHTEDFDIDENISLDDMFKDDDEI